MRAEHGLDEPAQFDRSSNFVLGEHCEVVRGRAQGRDGRRLSDVLADFLISQLVQEFHRRDEDEFVLIGGDTDCEGQGYCPKHAGQVHLAVGAPGLRG